MPPWPRPLVDELICAPPWSVRVPVDTATVPAAPEPVLDAERFELLALKESAVITTLPPVPVPLVAAEMSEPLVSEIASGPLSMDGLICTLPPFPLPVDWALMVDPSSERAAV